MILKNIKIHNIASIEDAEIDFYGSVLRGEPLFIITGATGAGKTTILDAICLALFDNTPRLASVGENTATFNDRYNTPKNKGQLDWKLMEDNPVRINHKGQLLRRGAGEGWCELVFEMENGEEYLARWAVTRAYGRADGKLQKPRRLLRNIKTGVTVESYVTDAVTALIGLTFDEFCRTTMLAQGEFTKFIQSTSKDKSDILEKLTGTEVYSQISRKIAEINSERKADYEQKKALLAGMVLMTEAERAQRHQAIADHGAACEQIECQVKSLTARHDWLKRDAQLRQAMTDSRQHLEILKRRKQEDSFLEEDQTIRDYQATAQAREWWSEIRVLQTETEQLAKSQDGYRMEFSRLNAELLQLRQEHDADLLTLSACQKALDEQKHHAAMLENGRAIQYQMENLLSVERRLARKNKAYREQEAEMPELRRRLEHFQTLLAQHQEQVTTKEAELGVVVAKREALNPKALNRLKESLHQRENLLTETVAAVSLLDSATKNHQEAKDNYQRKLADRESHLSAIASASLKVEEAQRDFDHAHLVYEQWRDTLSNSFKMIRATLAEGQICPLCQQKIGVAHVKDPDYETVLKPVVEQRNATERILQDVKVRLKSQKDLLKKAEKELKPLHQKWQEAEDLLHRQLGLTVDKYGLLMGVEDREKVLALSVGQMLTQLQLEKTSVERQQAELAVELKKVEDCDHDITALRSQKDQLMKQLASTQVLLGKAEKTLAEAEKARELLGKEIMADTETMALEREKLQQSLTYTDWLPQWEKDARSMIDRFVQAYTAYQQLQSQSSELTKTIALKASVIETSEPFRNHCMELLTVDAPQMDASVSKVREKTLVARWQTLLSTLQKWHATLDSKTHEWKKRQQMLDGFMASHPSLTEARIVYLSSLPADTVQSWVSSHDQLEKDIAMAMGAWSKLEEQTAIHQKEKPQLSDQDTVDSLEGNIAEIQREKTRLNQEIGKLRNELSEDDAKMRKHAEALAAMEKSRLAYEKWSMFDREFGSSDGTKFSRIAQSFILGHLLSRANVFLRQFSDRYELVSEPGSLVLLVRDRYVNQSPQYIKVLSGGESFMVSLSLALALAQLNKRKANVDVLFIDEGFGTLDEESLNLVMNTLEQLHQMGGRRLGIISHVEALNERIRAQVRVERVDPSKSKVTVLNA